MDHTPTTRETRKLRRLGRAFSTLAIAFMVVDGAMKLVAPDPVIESMVRLGYPPSSTFGIGLVELASALVHVVPRTSPLGAILLTGFLGGGVASHVRLQDPLFTHVLFPIYIGALLWAGLALRHGRLREVLPISSER